MIIAYWILGILTIYLFFVFVVLRLIIPFMGFRKPRMIKDLPEEIRATVENLKHQSRDPMSYLEASYNFRRSRWYTDPGKTICAFPLAFKTNLAKWWQEPGFAHCTTLNYILYVLLVNGGYFTESDVRFRHTMKNFFIHQYLQVEIDGKWIDVDTASQGSKLTIGQRNPFLG